MRLQAAPILITGAAGGIGRATAVALATQGARLALVDRDAAGLVQTRADVEAVGGAAQVHAADLTELDSLAGLVDDVARSLGGLSALVNIAGLISFQPLADETPAGLLRLATVNLVAPQVLTAAALPHLERAGDGRVVNIGSIFGSIGFAWFAAYSASKFGVRGFSEALRRELVDSPVGVTYVAPRATRTPLAQVFGRMADAVGMTLDTPERVAERIVRAMQRDQQDVYVGFPECLFVRLNGLLPRFVDKAVAKQDRLAEAFAREGSAPPAASPRDDTQPSTARDQLTTPSHHGVPS